MTKRAPSLAHLILSLPVIVHPIKGRVARPARVIPLLHLLLLLLPVSMTSARRSVAAATAKKSIFPPPVPFGAATAYNRRAALPNGTIMQIAPRSTDGSYIALHARGDTAICILKSCNFPV